MGRHSDIKSLTCPTILRYAALLCRPYASCLEHGTGRGYGILAPPNLKSKILFSQCQAISRTPRTRPASCVRRPHFGQKFA